MHNTTTYDCESLDWLKDTTKVIDTIKKKYQKNLSQPSVRVLRAESWLTVYRSLYIRMLCQLVGLGSAERANVKFTTKHMPLI